MLFECVRELRSHAHTMWKRACKCADAERCVSVSLDMHQGAYTRTLAEFAAGLAMLKPAD